MSSVDSLLAPAPARTKGHLENVGDHLMSPEGKKAIIRLAEDWHIFHALGLWQKLIPEIAGLIADARG